MPLPIRLTPKGKIMARKKPRKPGKPRRRVRPETGKIKKKPRKPIKPTYY